MHVFHRHVKMEPHVEQIVMDIVAHVEHSIQELIVKHVNKYHCLFSNLSNKSTRVKLIIA